MSHVDLKVQCHKGLWLCQVQALWPHGQWGLTTVSEREGTNFGPHHLVQWEVAAFFSDLN